MTKLKLLKYPIMMISVIIGLFLVQSLLKINLSNISKIALHGFEIEMIQGARKESLDALVEMALDIKELTVRIDSLERKTKTPKPELLSVELNEVSDVVSQLSMSQSKFTRTVLSGRKGYIFVGIYNSTDGKWTRAILLRQNSGESVTSAPNQLPVGGRFLVGTNIVLRDGLPPDDEQYFRSRKKIGVIPRGTHVALLDQPVGINRNHGVEYWAHVEVSE